MRSRVLTAKNWLFELYGACSLLVLTWMHQLETIFIVLHENQWEDTLLPGFPELFSPSVKRRALGSRLVCCAMERSRNFHVKYLQFFSVKFLQVLQSGIPSANSSRQFSQSGATKNKFAKNDETSFLTPIFWPSEDSSGQMSCNVKVKEIFTEGNGRKSKWKQTL